MIDIRNALREIGGVRKLIACCDFLYYGFTDNPDYWCNSVKDFRDNETNIGEGKTFELPRVQYFPQEGTHFEIKDPTGTLETQLYVDGKSFSQKLESFFGSPARLGLEDLTKGGFMYKVHFQKTRAGIYVLDFETQGSSVLDKSEKDYLSWRFPQLIPALVRS